MLEVVILKFQFIGNILTRFLISMSLIPFSMVFFFLRTIEIDTK